MRKKDGPGVIYCFDSSAFIHLNRINEDTFFLPKDLWEILEDMMFRGEIISHRIVFDEIYKNSDRSDNLSRWIKDKRNYFIGKSCDQLVHVSEIVKKFPKLIDPKHERDQADPWIIALAIGRTKQKTLFDASDVVIVSQEKPSLEKTIPAVCKFYNIRHISLREFFEENNIVISFNKSEI